MNLSKKILEKLNKISEQCCCYHDDLNDYSDNGYHSRIRSNPNRPNYSDNIIEEPDISDIIHDQNWSINPIKNDKEDVIYGLLVLESYTKYIKDIVIKAPTDFFNTAQFQDNINEFNHAINKSLLNLNIAKDVSDTFERLYNPRLTR